MDEKPGWRIGWRNLGRSRRRTLITASGLALGYVAVVVMSGLARGLVAEMIDNGTGILTGQLQAHSGVTASTSRVCCVRSPRRRASRQLRRECSVQAS